MANWIIGAGIGLIVAIVLILILHFSAFKGKNMGVLYVIMLLIFAIIGGVIQYSFFKKDTNSIPTPQEQIDSVTDTVTDNWKNGNGGFTFEQIQNSQNDEECPTYDDQIVSLTCYDFGSYVVFGFKNNSGYQNALFYKSGNGLILDGVISTTASFDSNLGFLGYKLETFRWNRDFKNEPYYFSGHSGWWIFGGDYDNLVSMSRQSAKFVTNLESVVTFSKDKAVNYALNQVPILTGQNATSYFIKFEDVELIGQASEGYKRINTFYNYLYENVKGKNYNTSYTVDATNSLCVPIPVELQSKYPISQDKKADYNNADYYGVYRCDIAVNLTYKKGTTLTSTTKNQDFVDTLKKDEKRKDDITVDEVVSNYDFTNVELKFVNRDESDLSKVDLVKHPLKVTFNCQNLSLSKVVTINSFDKLNAVNNVLLNDKETWTYLIESENLIFDDFRGSFSLDSEKTSLSFEYYYLDNYIIASVGLNPVGSIDESKIDLSQNPVRIILSNEKQTYQFVFDNNSQLKTQKSMLVEMGKYTYTILSEQLVFVSVTGSLTITTTDKVMLFNYSLKVDQPLSFGIGIVNKSDVGAGKIHLYSDSSNVTLIRDSLPSNKTYIVGCYVYDDEGRLIESFSHTHQVTGNCTETWVPKFMVSGQKYTIQLRFTPQDDSQKTYLSDITSFTYDSSKGYEISYNVTNN